MATVDTHPQDSLTKPASASEGLRSLPAAELWSPAAQADAREGAAWLGYLAQRNPTHPGCGWLAPAAAADAIAALAWGASPDTAEWLAQLGSALAANKTPRRLEACLLEELSSPVSDSPAPDSLTVDFALRSVAWAAALPALASRVDADAWWSLCDRLMAIVGQAEQISPGEDPEPSEAIAQQLLAGELPLTLAAQLPELRPLKRLRPLAKTNLSEGLTGLTDGEGLLQGGFLEHTPLLLGCWTRCGLIGESADKRAWSSGADTQYGWLVRQTLRLVGGKGRFPFADAPVKGTLALFDAALDLAGDESDLAAAQRRLPKVQQAAKRKLSASLLPEPSNHSEWAHVAVLAAGWDAAAPRLTVDYAQNVRMEFVCEGKRLLSGEWPLAASLEGQPVEPDGDWAEQCWFSDEDCDYLELTLDLVGGGKIERQFFLSREDGVAYLSEILMTEGEGAKAMRIENRLPLGPGVAFSAEEETRDGWLTVKGKPAAGVLPLALPEWRADPRCGELNQQDERLVGVIERIGRNLVNPLWIDLSPKRFKKQRTWRQLTVAQSLERVDHDTAVAFRAQAGKEQWVVYRSLDPPANRTFIGHNLASEGLIGKFLASGEIDEYFEIDGDED
ncbi:hypothetical protein Mal64_04220 [Pseudobythopirellula maris]|uniref:Uncharacterized protein n=1 Tax=Pseudobythopirellula maris TaxID=2527991 RepID=A0A5C5ZRA9_9BACT|nr:hypothetical protein [Pseudobythopirellula maris]TWT90039.1 hypothetical protein Mal64_04220 [Pseudobythopirellula maris]